MTDRVPNSQPRDTISFFINADVLRKEVCSFQGILSLELIRNSLELQVSKEDKDADRLLEEVCGDELKLTCTPLNGAKSYMNKEPSLQPFRSQNALFSDTSIKNKKVNIVAFICSICYTQQQPPPQTSPSISQTYPRTTPVTAGSRAKLFSCPYCFRVVIFFLISQFFFFKLILNRYKGVIFYNTLYLFTKSLHKGKLKKTWKII